MKMSNLHILFDGPPGPEAGRFVEVENDDGKSVRVGEWREREDGYWELIISVEDFDEWKEENGQFGVGA